MKKIDKILVCVDLSKYSMANLEYAVAIAGNTNAEILILNVLNQRDINAMDMLITSYPDNVDIQKYVKETTESRRKEVEKIIRENFSDQKKMITIHTATGIPFEEILKKADEDQVDLIVIGNKGKGNLARTLFGSQAEKVFRHSSIPVVSIRSTPHKRMD